MRKLTKLFSWLLLGCLMAGPAQAIELEFDEINTFLFPGDTERPAPARISPDGTLIAYGSSVFGTPQSVNVMTLHSGIVYSRALGRGVLHQLRFSPDSAKLYVDWEFKQNQRLTVDFADLSTCRQTLEYAREPETEVKIVSTDRQTIAYVTKNAATQHEPCRVRIYRGGFEQVSSFELGEGRMQFRFLRYSPDAKRVVTATHQLSAEKSIIEPIAGSYLQLWDVASGKNLITVFRKHEYVHDVHYREAGQLTLLAEKMAFEIKPHLKVWKVRLVN